jgi:hypothetical protein
MDSTDSKINYQALVTPLKLKTLLKTSNLSRRAKRFVNFGIFLYSLIFLPFWAYAAYLAFSDHHLGMMDKLSALGWPLVAPALALAAYFIHLYKSDFRRRLGQFAADNGCVYTAVQRRPDYKGLWSKQLNGRWLSDVIDNPNKGWQLATFNYNVDSKTQQRFGMLRITLPGPVPNVVLDAVNNNRWKRDSNLPLAFKRGQSLQLEGDFNKYFNVYVPEGYGVDALYFLTPDVMQVLITSGKTYDFEFIDKYLYLYDNVLPGLSTAAWIQYIQTSIQTCDYFAAQFRPEVRRYQDDRQASQVVSQATAVAPSGQRLKTDLLSTSAKVWLAAVLAVLLIQLFISLNR